MSAGLIFIIILCVCFIFRNEIARWIRGFMARRTEDAVRRMFGMPTRKEEEKMRKQHRKQSESSTSSAYRSSGSEGDVVKNMQRYAEDVDYVEVKQFEQTDIAADVETEDKSGRKNTKIEIEEQVSDAEYIEIK